MNSVINRNTENFKWCVIVPTYNNDKSLRQILQSVLEISQNVIVVNDGSTDDTTQILADYEHRLELISYKENKGKGYALRLAFKQATKLGFTHVITIDSDGQHFASDLPAFVEQIYLFPNALVIGARNMDSENVPGKSSFGNKFSNFWFRLETGINLTDTQSGYRLYPLHAMQNLWFYTKKFEFEIEVIVKAAWKGIAVKNIPIKIHYAPGKLRVSHFRPFQDFLRISILNTYFVILAVLYYIPLRFIKKISCGNFKTLLKEQFLNKNESIARKSISIGFGVFMGIFPVWGFQMLIGLVFAELLKLNKAIFLIAANISIPPLVPLILFLSFKVGALFFSDTNEDLFFSQGITLETVKANAAQYLMGAVVLALVCGFAAGILAYAIIQIIRVFSSGNQDFK